MVVTFRSVQPVVLDLGQPPVHDGRLVFPCGDDSAFFVDPSQIPESRYVVLRRICRTPERWSIFQDDHCLTTDGEWLDASGQNSGTSTFLNRVCWDSSDAALKDYERWFRRAVRAFVAEHPDAAEIVNGMLVQRLLPDED